MRKQISGLVRSLALFSLCFIVTACGGAGGQEHQGHGETKNTPQTAEKLTITFATDPQSAKPDQSTILKATVKSGNQPITDAKVELELWKGKEKHQRLSTTMKEKGVYQTAHTFREAGNYTIIVHVTTPAVHQMITQTIPVGSSSERETHGHDHGEGVTLHIESPSAIQAGKNAKFKGLVMDYGKPLENAEVQFEYWKDGSDKHAYSDTAELKPGEYETTLRFDAPGTYRVKLHVEKEKIHDHTETTVKVK